MHTIKEILKWGFYGLVSLLLIATMVFIGAKSQEDMTRTNKAGGAPAVPTPVDYLTPECELGMPCWPSAIPSAGSSEGASSTPAASSTPGGSATAGPSSTATRSSSISQTATATTTKSAGNSVTPTPNKSGVISATATASGAVSATPTAGASKPAGGIISSVSNGILNNQTTTAGVPTLVMATLVSAAIPVALSVSSAAPVVANLVFRLLQRPFAVLSWPRRKSSWGIIYDSTTKNPVSGAILRIYSEPDGKLRDQQISTRSGSFGFLVQPGQYSITASKNTYQFPSNLVGGTSDGNFTNIYHGEAVNIGASKENQAPINLNIPVDRTDLEMFDIAVVKTMRGLKQFFAVLRFPLLVFGTFLTVFSAYYYRWLLNYLFIGLYAAIWTAEIYNLLKPRTFGLVKDKNGSPIDLALIRAISTKGKVAGSATSGVDGKFYMNLEAGDYGFHISKTGFVAVKSPVVRISKTSDFNKLSIELQKISRRGS